MQDRAITKILFVEEDELTFEFKKCIAQALQNIKHPTEGIIEMYYAQDATEGLKILEKERPDIVVLDDNINEECELFLESLSPQHPPIVLQVDGKQKTKIGKLNNLSCMQRDDSLDSINSVLAVATSILQSQNQSMPQ